MNFIRKAVEKLSPYEPGEQPADPHVIKLNTNENPYPPSPEVRKLLRSANADMLKLYPDPVCLRLRMRIAELHSCNIDNVFVGNGSDEVLTLCTLAFVEDDESIGYFVPSYSLYPVLTDIRDVCHNPIMLTDNFTLPANFPFSRKKWKNCSLFFIANPNAPTGMLFPFEHISKFCRIFPGVVVIDEAYVDFASRDCMELALRYHNVLIVRTLSKSFSLAGLRVGYSVGHKDLIQALFKIKNSYNVSRLAQEIAMAALNDIPYMRQNVEKIKVTRQRLTEALSSLGYTVYPSETNFLWVRPEPVKAEYLYKELKKRKILIRFFKTPQLKDFVRITIGTDWQVDKLIEAIQKIHKSWNKQKET
jgi:histidinol-phosphate aminotransferase